jgi:HEAT repeat protein
LAPYALWALGEIGSPAALDALVQGASDSSGWRVRWSAVKSLGDVGGEKAIQALVGALGDRDHRVRSRASERLQRIGEPAVKPLAYRLRHSNRDTRSEARKTLVGIGTPAALAELRREKLMIWVPVGVMVIGLLLVILWLGSMIVS